MEKTIEQWYEQLPEPIRSEALEARRKAIARGSSYSNDKTAESIEDAIVNGFGWYPDGGSRDKWREICDRAMSGEFDKPQATDIDARIVALEERMAGHFRRIEDAIAIHNEYLAELRAAMSTPPQPEDPPTERIATDVYMQPGLRVRTPEGWVGEVVMKEGAEIFPYGVSEGWGKRWTRGDARDFTILPGQDND